MYNQFWRFLNRRKEPSPNIPGKQASSLAHKQDTELKELIGQWIYDHLAGVAVAIADRKGIITHFNGVAEALTSIRENTAQTGLDRRRACHPRKVFAIGGVKES